MKARGCLSNYSDSFYSKEFSKRFRGTPDLTMLDFRPPPIFTADGEISDLAEAKRRYSIYHLGCSLSTRSFSVKLAHVYSAILYERRSDNDSGITEKLNSRRLFIHHADSFFLLYFSYLDHLSHLLYEVFRLKAKSTRDITWGWVCDRINKVPGNSQLKNIITEFYGATSGYKNIRNSFAHKFHPAVPDYRPEYFPELNKLHFPSAKHISAEDLYSMIEPMYELLLKFTLSLSKSIPAYLQDQGDQ